MSVELDPPELGFRRPFQQEVSQVLRLKNPNSDPVAFKVKTTAPKQYCVRPNSGRIDPGGDVEVSVLLQAMKEDPPMDAKCRDKFLVQSTLVPATQEFTNVQSIWSKVEETDKTLIQERKIRVVFLPAGDAASSTPMRTNGVSESNGVNSPPSPEAVTPARGSSGGSASRPGSRPSDTSNFGDARASTHNPSMSASGSVFAAAKESIPTSGEELKSQLADAKAEIARLSSQLTESAGLRQRKTGGESAGSKDGSSTALASAPQAPGGVSPQIVAALCLISFLLAYFFF